MRQIKNFLPVLIGVGVAGILYFTTGWWGFGLIFTWIGGSVTLGIVLADRLNGKRKDLGRRTAILMISPIFLLFLGFRQHENLQLEETVFYLALFLLSLLIPLLFIYAGYDYTSTHLRSDLGKPDQFI